MHSSVVKINSSWFQCLNVNQVKSLVLEVNTGWVYVVCNRAAGRQCLLRTRTQNPQGKDHGRIKSSYVRKSAINRTDRHRVIILIPMAYKG